MQRSSVRAPSLGGSEMPRRVTVVDWGGFLGAAAILGLVVGGGVFYFFGKVPALAALAAATWVSFAANTKKRTIETEADRIEQARREAEDQERVQQNVREILGEIEAKRQERIREMEAKHGEKGALLASGKFDVGMTEELIVDYFGHPEGGIEERVLKTKVSRTYKYAPGRKGQYLLRLKFDNGVLVGWEDSR